MLAALLCAAPTHTHAQQNQPIYPAYDGFIKNPDGSYTLSFSYFSHNADLVTIAPGANNAFAPLPGDRMQPTTFKPGHWRFQCVMVVGPELADRMQWTLSYAGTTTGTGEDMLQSDRNIEGAAELSKIDYARAPRGVCLNQAPRVRVLGATPRGGQIPTLMAVAGDEFNLAGSADDEGLPRGKPFTIGWKLLKGPGAVTFSDANAARTTLSFKVPGHYELELTASDSELTSATRVHIVVAPAP